ARGGDDGQQGGRDQRRRSCTGTSSHVSPFDVVSPPAPDVKGTITRPPRSVAAGTSRPGQVRERRTPMRLKLLVRFDRTFTGSCVISIVAKLDSSSSKNTLASSRARWAPRQKWAPMPKPRGGVG